MKVFFSLFVAFAMFLMISIVTESKTMWGARRKSTNDEDGNFVYRKGSQATKTVKSPKVTNATPRNVASRKNRHSRRGRSIFDDITSKLKQPDDLILIIQSFFDQLITSLDTVLDMPNFEEVINLDTVREFIDQVPQLKNLPEIKSVLDSPEMQDPAFLKSALQENLSLMKDQLYTMKDLFNDPQKVSEVLDNLPTSVLQLFNSIKSGEFRDMRSMLDDIPGISSKQKEVLSQVLAGNIEDLDWDEILSQIADDSASSESFSSTDNILENIDSFLNFELDSADISLVKDQLMEHPELQSMMGISDEVMGDDVAFGAFFLEQSRLLKDMLKGTTNLDDISREIENDDEDGDAVDVTGDILARLQGRRRHAA